MHQQQPQPGGPMFPVIPSFPPTNITTDQIQKLLERFKEDHQEVVYKMKKYWRTANHAASLENLWAREILKHRDLSYEYWQKVIELAEEFFDA
ncbi:SSXT protein (N-terminal region) [Orobanche minor]